MRPHATEGAIARDDAGWQNSEECGLMRCAGLDRYNGRATRRCDTGERDRRGDTRRYRSACPDVASNSLSRNSNEDEE